MSKEILSIAIFEPVQGSEEAAFATMRELRAALQRGQFSRDLMYRDAKTPNWYVLLRYWKSEEARRAALEDPEVLRCYARLAHEVRIVRVFETLEEVDHA
jgi:quinol monooxygenase YgiN